MKVFRYEEFIKYSDVFQKGKNDFYGEYSTITEKEQKEFLEQYYSYHTKRLGREISFDKAVKQEEILLIQSALEKSRKDETSSLFFASKKKYKSPYKGWCFYTDRVYVQNGKILFKDSWQWPMPCAKYEFNIDRLRRFSFRVKISSAFYHKSPEGILSTTTGRYVELRKGCREVIKLYFSPDGTFCYKDGWEERYHYSLRRIGTYEFDKWLDVEIIFGEKEFCLIYDGKMNTFGYSYRGIPDNLFLGGGMQPVDSWEFEPVAFVTHEKKITNFFKIASEEEEEEIGLGNVELPFALGTQEHKDEMLILRKTFFAKLGSKQVLHIDALDPGGEVFINGESIVRKDDFQAFDLDISPYIQNGENHLEIHVFPRAPEVLYAWHKHDDFYNGWFCLGAEIREEEYVPSPLIIKTQSISDGHIQFQISLGLEKFEGKKCKIYIQKIYPDQSEKRLLKECTVTQDGIRENFDEALQVWDTNAPNLYKITLELWDKDHLLCTKEEETGFRTVEQKDGAIFINGQKTILKGALNMQFLPPYESIPIHHVCPTETQIIEQVLAIKNMNGNCLRMHQLGYGCADKRFTEICDRLGVFLIWTTRLIDSVENLLWIDEWKQATGYQQQMLQVINAPSIIMWEGSNELHTDLKCIDKIYDSFTSTVREVDSTRLICPVSHLYYGGGIYDFGCKYYTTSGCLDELGQEVESSFGWKDDLVVRSAHTYSLLLGYGASWQDMLKQNWKWQPELFDETQKAYIISEFAVIGRQNPETPEAKVFINKDSYELTDEIGAFGFQFSDEEWRLSQGYQALCASLSVKQLRKNDADGMLWCSLWGGANNASYLKPIVDFYGYKKLAYYQLSEGFIDALAFNAEPDVLLYPGYEIIPMLVGLRVGNTYQLTVQVLDEDFVEQHQKKYPAFCADNNRVKLSSWTPTFGRNGYYIIRYTITEL